MFGFRLSLVVLSLLATLEYRAADTTSPRKPNILFILADDLGYGDLGCYGQKKIQTPNIDRLAAEGMRFTQFYAGDTVCAPSRCVLMTGLHSGHGYIRGNAKVNLRPEDVAIAEVLKKAGYMNGLMGKWGLGHEGSTGVPTKKGFDYFFGYLDQTHAHNYYPEFLVRNEERVKLNNVVVKEGKPYEEVGAGYASKKIEYSHDLAAEEARKWIEQNRNNSFFLYLAFTPPHANNEATKALGDGQEVPDYRSYEGTDWTKPNKGFAAMVSRLDGDVGRIMRRLKDLSIDDNTLVIFASDNGPQKEGGNDPAFFGSSGPLRGIKRAMYEGGIRIPFIVRWPGRIKAGTVSDHVGYFGDFFATACEVAGVETPVGLDSISFLPTLLGDTAKQRKHDFLYWEFHEGGFKQAVRMGDWKAVRNSKDGATELYDLSKDLGEEHDVAREHPEIVKKIEDYLKTARTESEHWPVTGAPAALRRAGAAGNR